MDCSPWAGSATTALHGVKKVIISVNQIQISIRHFDNSTMKAPKSDKIYIKEEVSKILLNVIKSFCK